MMPWPINMQKMKVSGQFVQNPERKGTDERTDGVTDEYDRSLTWSENMLI